MEVKPNNYCILIASHISKGERVCYLKECLNSLINQTMKVPIYVSISFENNNVKEHCITELNTEKNITTCHFLKIIIQQNKTPQMVHYCILSDLIYKKHNWVMFCDDDDTYHPDRTMAFAKILTINEKNILSTPECYLAGLYESNSRQSHKESRKEYWCYCINAELLNNFMGSLKKYPDILSNKCCDILFGEYLRRKSNNWIFLHIYGQLYNYRVEDNNDSITGFIKSKQTEYTLNSSPPEDVNSTQWKEYLKDWNEYVSENINIFLHDTYLRSIIGYKFDRILKAEFRYNHSLTEHIDKTHIAKLKELYDKIIKVSDEIYDIKLE